MENARILVVEDEPAIGDMVDIILRKEGFAFIDVCRSYMEADSHIRRFSYDIHILDIMLPDGTGLSLAKSIRERSEAPIFFLTAKASEADILRGFMHGADDYIVKPFNPMELAARVKVQTVRYLSTKPKKNVYAYEVFQLDVGGASLKVRGEHVQITQKQFQLLEFFCSHPNQVLSKEQLYENVWGFNHYVDDNTIMVHIRKLREKLEVDPSRPELLVTVRGLGYKLEV